jgi:hypothetical protein
MNLSLVFRTDQMEQPEHTPQHYMNYMHTFRSMIRSKDTIVFHLNTHHHTQRKMPHTLSLCLLMAVM